MRLVNTRELKLKSFSDYRVPAYAILSHTWEEEEVTLQDMETDRGTTLLGYQKVKNACSVALEGGYEYIWIDTCCINKTSSAELQEAINSMYRWYTEAQECYAYLADVLPGPDYREKFRKSRWFTRGWTLQELIAPSTVIFLNSKWKVINNKSSLHQLISEITGIPGGFLLGDDLLHASIAQKMSWASRRETSRVEDLAYCLMGLFDISMPMLYGEGRKSFIRLQEEIMKFSDDHSIFAWESKYLEDHGEILAKSPSEFANSGDVIKMDDSFAAARSPLTLSSRGIRLSIPIISTGSISQVGILSCTRLGKENMRLAIYLQDETLANEDFIRYKTFRLPLIALKKGSLTHYPLTDLYVKQWRSADPSNRGAAEKCAIKFEGQDVASRQIYIHPSWEIHDDGQIVSTTALPYVGTFGRLLVICKDGNSFQVLLRKSGGSLAADIDDKMNTAYSGRSYPKPVQHGQVVRKVNDEHRVRVAIKKRILIFGEARRLTGIMEISYSDPGMWLDRIAVLEGDIMEKSLLSFAVNQGHEAVVEMLLDTKKVHTDMMLLISAAKAGWEGVVKRLLDESVAGIDSKDEDGRTPLSRAAGNGERSIVKLLLYKGAQIEFKDNNGWTPLFWAARNGNEIIVELLLKKGAQVEAKDYDSWTPLFWAITNNHKRTVKLLLGYDAHIEATDKDGWTPLMWGVADQHEGIVELLLKHGAHVDVNGDSGRTLLLWAVTDGHGGIVRLLVEKGSAYVRAEDDDGWKLLLTAAVDAPRDIVQLLLLFAPMDKSETLMELLFEKGKPGWISLLSAAAKGHETVVQLFLEMGAELESKDHYGQTPLARAARNGHEGVVKMLLRAGADLESKDQSNSTPLMWASRNGYKGVVKQLLAAGIVDLDFKDNNGLTPLSWAARNRHYTVVRQLLLDDINPYPKDNDS